MKPLARTAASSFDEELFNEIQNTIHQLSGQEEIEADQLGLTPESDDEANYLRGQEMALTIASPGWGYIKEIFAKLVKEAESAYRDAETDEEILRKQREWKAMEKATNRAIASAESAATVPHPNQVGV